MKTPKLGRSHWSGVTNKKENKKRMSQDLSVATKQSLRMEPIRRKQMRWSLATPFEP